MAIFKMTIITRGYARPTVEFSASGQVEDEQDGKQAVMILRAFGLLTKWLMVSEVKKKEEA
jgi:hypothetical protein